MSARLTPPPWMPLAVALAVAPSGCDWRTFDDLEARTPVLAVGAPGSYGPTDDFGRHLLALSAPAMGSTGGRFIVSAQTSPALGIMELDAKGGLTGRAKGDQAFLPEDLIHAITSLAEVPGGKQVLLGAPRTGADNGTVYVMTLGTNAVTVLDMPDMEDRFGLGVAAGALAGGAEPDFVVASGDTLSVYTDGDSVQRAVAPASQATCPVSLSQSIPLVDRPNRAVVVADLAGKGRPQIVLGTPAAQGDGAVSVFDVDPTTGMATCAFSLSHAPARFGHALAVGDFDADGTPDLLVGAPPEGAFWIRGPLAAGAAVQTVKLTKTSASPELGFSVAAGDLDGKPGDEAIVGDPNATVAGKMLAGEVHVAGGATLGAEVVPPVRRHEPAASDVFGTQVAAMHFCKSGCSGASPMVQDLLLVGASTRVFTYFVLAAGAKDPRN